MLEFYPEEIELIEDDSQPTDTDDEIRKCWDAHAVTDANSEPAPIEEWPISAGISTYFIRFEREDLRKLRDLSEAEGILTIPMEEKLIKRAISESPRRQIRGVRARRWAKGGAGSGGESTFP